MDKKIKTPKPGFNKAEKQKGPKRGPAGSKGRKAKPASAGKGKTLGAPGPSGSAPSAPKPGKSGSSVKSGQSTLSGAAEAKRQAAIRARLAKRRGSAETTTASTTLPTPRGARSQGSRESRRARNSAEWASLYLWDEIKGRSVAACTTKFRRKRLAYGIKYGGMTQADFLRLCGEHGTPVKPLARIWQQAERVKDKIHFDAVDLDTPVYRPAHCLAGPRNLPARLSDETSFDIIVPRVLPSPKGKAKTTASVSTASVRGRKAATAPARVRSPGSSVGSSRSRRRGPPSWATDSSFPPPGELIAASSVKLGKPPDEKVMRELWPGNMEFGTVLCSYAGIALGAAFRTAEERANGANIVAYYAHRSWLNCEHRHPIAELACSGELLGETTSDLPPRQDEVLPPTTLLVGPTWEGRLLDLFGKGVLEVILVTFRHSAKYVGIVPKRGSPTAATASLQITGGAPTTIRWGPWCLGAASHKEDGVNYVFSYETFGCILLVRVERDRVLPDRAPGRLRRLAERVLVSDPTASSGLVGFSGVILDGAALRLADCARAGRQDDPATDAVVERTLAQHYRDGPPPGGDVMVAVNRVVLHRARARALEGYFSAPARTINWVVERAHHAPVSGVLWVAFLVASSVVAGWPAHLAAAASLGAAAALQGAGNHLAGIIAAVSGPVFAMADALQLTADPGPARRRFEGNPFGPRRTAFRRRRHPGGPDPTKITMAQSLLWVVAEEVLRVLFGDCFTAFVIGLEGAAVGPDYWPTAAMHFCCGLLPFYGAILLHFAWNESCGHSGRLSDTLWHLRQIDRRQPAYGICAGDLLHPPTGESTKTATLVQPARTLRCVARHAVFPVGPSVRRCTPKVYRCCCHNDNAAIAVRVLKKPLWDDDHKSTYSDWLAVLPWAFDQWPQGGPEVHVAPCLSGRFDEDFESWAARYPAHARPGLNAARQDVQSRRANRRDLRVKAFIKVERLPAHLLECLFDPVKPRIIQGRSDFVKVATGPYFWRLGKLLAGWWGLDSPVTYASGLSAEEVGHWAHSAETDGLLPLCFDFSAWDSTVSPGAFSAWFAFCDRVGLPPEVRQIMARRSGRLFGATRFGAKYSKIGQVSSGDGDTSVGNSFIHGIGWRALLEGICPKRYRVLVLGDDSVVAVPRSVVSAIIAAAPRHWSDLGFEIKAVATGDWNSATFCSGYFWHCGGTRVFGPNPGRVLAKTFWTDVTFRRKENQLAWLRGVVLGLEASTSFVPVLSELVGRLANLLGPGRVITRRSFEPRILAQAHHDLSYLALRQYSEITGIAVADIQSASRQCAGCRLDTEFCDPVFQRMVIQAL